MREKTNIMVVKRNGTTEEYDFEKIKNAINKSANRINHKFTLKELKKIKSLVNIEVDGESTVTVDQLHGIVEKALQFVNKDVAVSYMNYRNYKKEFELNMLNDIESQVMKVLTEVDRENSNSNTRLISTKRTEVAKKFSKELYQKIHLNTEELQAVKEGYFFVHDFSDLLLPQYNCALGDIGNVMKGGFEVEGVFYTEPKNIRTAVGQLGDILLTTTSQNYGGYTCPHVDKILAPYYKMSIELYEKELLDISENILEVKVDGSKNKEKLLNKIRDKAKDKAYDDLKQSLQGVEVKLNTVANARGSFPFTTFTFGSIENEYESEVAKAILQVRLEGHGLPNKKQGMIFPKLVFLHEPALHNEGCEYEWLFDYAIKVSSKRLYPDFLSSHFKREGKWVSPMGCRAFLSDYRDENGELRFIGRGNLGAISLNLPMIYMKAKVENQNFYEVLDYYMEMIRNLHKKRIEYVGRAKASSNEIMWCRGGAWGGNLNPNDDIAPILKSWTVSFGVTAMNELSILNNGKSLREDNSFAVEVADYINKKIDEFKELDGISYAYYNAPAENLAGVQVQQFRKKYGIISNVSDREYFSNGFHLHVSEDITSFEKQDLEEELFHKGKGGAIQYGRVNPNNFKSLKQFIVRGLEKGFYQGVNFNSCFCEDCGNDFVGTVLDEPCPKCGSDRILEQVRVIGYLGKSRFRGDRSMNDTKMAEFKDRKSM